MIKLYYLFKKMDIREKYLREGQQRVLDYLAQSPIKHLELPNEDFAIVAVSSEERVGEENTR